MNAELIRRLLNKQPFEPFEIQVSSGEKYIVRHPEPARVARSRLIIYYPETDQIALCSLLHLSDVIWPVRASMP